MIKVKAGLLLIAFMLIVAAEQTSPITYPLPDLPALPTDWQVTAATLADVTGDGAVEWVLVVWRPWQDWPIQQWSDLPSPIAGFHDAEGNSCHLILLDPQDGHEIWAGSALPAPILGLTVDNVDEDGFNEVWTVRGSYADGRDGPGTHVDVWHWNGFGFTLAWRSLPGSFAPSCLARADRCGAQNPSE